MHVLVTGSTGLLGNNIVRQLIERQDRVRVLVRDGSDSRPLEGLPVEQVTGDFSDEQSVKNAIAGVDLVIHSAGYVRIGWSGLSEARKVNVEGTRTIAQAAKGEGVRLLHVSTVNTLALGTATTEANEETDVIGQVPCSYVTSKREADEMLLDLYTDGLDIVIVHPGFMLGPWDWKPSSGQMLIEVASRFTPVAPSGGCSVADVRDVSAGILNAAEHGKSGRNYILAGENMTYFDLWKVMAEITGGQPPKIKMGPLVRVLAGAVTDLFGKLSGRERLVNSAAIRMGSQFHYYSSERAIKELGYQVRPVGESIQDAWKWFQEYGYVK